MKKTVIKRRKGAGGSIFKRMLAQTARVSPGGTGKAHGLDAINPDDTASKHLVTATSYLTECLEIGTILR
jgi:hypothetical protein